MKHFGLASAMVIAAALLAQPAAAADYRGPRHHAKPRVVYEQPTHPKRGWTCNAYGNCQPNWGWGKDVATGPIAMVIVARGDIPLYELPDRYTGCRMPRRVWDGVHWNKVWDVNCVR